MHPSEPLPPVSPTTTSKEEPLQLDRLPPGPPCELNYRQGRPVLAVPKRLGWQMLGVAAACAMFVSVTTPLSGVTWGVAGVLYVAVALVGVVGVAQSIAEAATRWLTAAPQIDPVTLNTFRAAWRGQAESSRFADSLRPRTTRPSPGQIVREFETACGLLLLIGVALLCLGAVVVSVLPAARLPGLLLLVAATATAAVRMGRVHAVGPHRLWFYTRLAVLPLASPQPPWVLVPAPEARRNYERLQAAAFFFLSSFGLLFWGAVSVHLPPVSLLPVVAAWLVFVTAGAAVFSLLVVILLVPTVRALEDALDPVRGPDAHPEWTPLDGYSARLRASGNELERDCLLLGAHPTRDFPYLLQGRLLTEHLHILGPPGTGKTSIGLTNLLTQLIARGDGPCVVIDCKGDPGLFNTVRREAARNGRTFKFYTNLPNRPTYAFNPFDRETFDKLTMPDAVGLLINSLNLSFGDDYGRAWFSTASRVLLKRSYEYAYPAAAPGKRGRKKSTTAAHGIESFADLNAVIQYLMKGKDGEQFQAARHLSFVVERLAEYQQLNLAPDRSTGERHPALENAIHMPEVLRNKEVVYFYLSGLVDSANVGEVGRLAIYSLLTACQHHFDETGRAANAYCVVDEAQTVIAQNIANVLAKARSFGLSLTLAHQSMSQLNPPGGVDLRELVTSCTAVKQIFAARDPWMLKHVSAMSGEVKYASVSYDATPEAVAAGGFDYRQAVPNEKGEARVRVAESVGNRLTPQDILEIGADPKKCILAFEQAYGLTQSIGYFPAQVDWVTTREEADRRAASPWPTASEDTITVVPNWPSANEHTVTPTGAPASPPPDPHAAGERLRQMKQSLDLDSDE